MATAVELCQTTKTLLAGAGIPEPDAKARILVAHGLNISLGDVFLHGDADADAASRIEKMARRCAAGEPVEYVTGRAYFRHITLEVSPDVLIPRQETELVAGQAIELIREYGYGTALDLCTGSGCIAISIAAETQAAIEACDLSEAALRLAVRNAAENGTQVRFFTSDMFDGVTRKYDIIVSNPPYVSEDEYAALDDGVRLYEPRIALAAGDGLDYYRIIAKAAREYISKGGALVLEIGAGQAADMAALLEAGGFGSIKVIKDYTGRDRIVTARNF